MKRIADVHLLSLAEAERRLQIRGKPPGSKLERMLLKAERDTGLKLMDKTAGGHRRVTMSVIRRYLPRLIPSTVAELERTLRRTIHQLDERIAAAVAERVADQVEPRLEEHWLRDETIAGSVLQHEKRLKVIETTLRKITRNRT
jgi:hypothetical protein